MPKVETFVETGTNVGTTARYMAEMYQGIPVYSCEPDPEAFRIAQQNLKEYKNVSLYKMKSPDFLYRIHSEYPELNEKLNFYFLDAHGYGYTWPLRDEVKFITNTLSEAIILIDDVRVPHLPHHFRYDNYESQVCDLEHIVESLASNRTYVICYPNYTERTSRHHPLTGYMFVGYGEQVTRLVQDYGDNFLVTTLKR